MDKIEIAKSMKENLIKCTCGCESPAVFLCTGFDFDPSKPGNKGNMFVDQPCCYSSAMYLENSAHELNLFPFIKIEINKQVHDCHFSSKIIQCNNHIDVRKCQICGRTWQELCDFDDNYS